MPEHYSPCDCPAQCPSGNALYFKFTTTLIGGDRCGECAAKLNATWFTTRGEGCNYFCSGPVVCSSGYGWNMFVNQGIAVLDLLKDGAQVGRWEGPTYCDCLSSNNPPDPGIGRFKLTLTWVEPLFEECVLEPQDVIYIEIIDPPANDVEDEAAGACWNLSPCIEVPTGQPSIAPTGPGNYDGNCTKCGCGSSSPIPVPDLSLRGADTGGAGQCSQICFNPALGNLSIELTTPGAGVDGANPSITYNSSDYYPGGSEFGEGTSAFWTQRAAPVGSGGDNVDIHGCDGSKRRYGCMDENGDFISMGMNPNKLQAVTGGYVETEPSGRKYHYEGTSTLLSHIVNPDGKRWTIIRDFSSGGGGTGGGPGGAPGGGPGTTTGGGFNGVALEGPENQRTTVAFTTSGNLDYIGDIHGRQTQFTRTGGVVKVTNPELCETELHYKTGYLDNQRLVEKMVLPDGSDYQFTYTVDDWIETITNPQGEVMTFDYVDWTTTKVTGFDGGEWTLAHTYRRNVKTVTSPEGVATEYDWQYGKLMGVTSPSSVATTMTQGMFAGHRLLESVETPLGTTTYNYDSNGRVEAVVDPHGHHTTYVRDSIGNVTETIQPTGVRHTTLYDSNDRPEATILPTGGRVTRVYGTGMTVDATIDAFGNRTSYTYHNGQRDSMTTPLGSVSSTVYDDINRTLANVDALGNRSTLVYTTDSCSTPTATINPLGHRTTNVFDNGQVSATIDAMGARTSFVYNDAGNRVATISPSGLRSTTVYNTDRQPVASISPAGIRSTTLFDTAGRAVARIAPNGARSTTIFDATTGLQVASIDPYGNRSTTVYNSHGQTIASVNPLGARSTQVYDSFDRPVASIDPLGNIATTVYNSIGQTVASIDPLGNVSTSVYDIDGSAVASINALGHISTTVYDADRQAVASIDPMGNRHTNVFDAAGRSVASITPLGFRSTNVYDAAGQSIASIDAEGNVSTTVYDANGQSVASIDPLGNISTTVYTLSGSVEATIDAAGNRTTPVYDAYGRNVATIDAKGNRTSMVYNSVGQTVASINALGFRTTNVYDSAGQVVASIDPLGNRYTNVFDDAGQTVATINPLGQRSSMVYNIAGQTVASVDANGKTTTSIYDAAGRTVAEIDAKDQVTTTVYDGVSRVIERIDPLGYTTKLRYDSLGRVTCSQNAHGTLVTFGYDEDSNRTCVIDGRGYRVTSVFDGTKQPIRKIDALGRTSTLTYDAASRQINQVHPDGLVTTFIHDTVGRLVAQTSDSDIVTHAYDATGSLISVANKIGTIAYTYDAIGNRTGIVWPNHNRATYAYLSDGNLASVALSDMGRTTYSYDAVGLCSTVEGPITGLTTLVRDTLGRVAATHHPSGLRVSRSHDEVGNTVEIKATTGATDATFCYGYDGARNRTWGVEPFGDRVTWSYDGTGQLTREERSGVTGYDRSFGYDGSGNRVVSTFDGVTTTSVYDPANQLVSSDRLGQRTSYTFDSRGNQTVAVRADGSRTTLVWNGSDQLVQTVDATQATVTMSYGPNGLRYATEDSDGTHLIDWEDQAPVRIFGPNQTVCPVLLPNRNGLVASHSGTEASYPVLDALGSVWLTENPAGLVQIGPFSAFGERLSTSIAPVFSFAGGHLYITEGSDQYLAAYRPYVPSLSRWLRADPLGYKDGWNLYTYCRNSPTQFIDPSGLKTITFRNPKCPSMTVDYELPDARRCVVKLRSLVLQLSAVGLGCAADMMGNFIAPVGALRQDPFCPRSCIDAFKNNPWVQQKPGTLFDKHGGPHYDPLRYICGQRNASDVLRYGPKQHYFRKGYSRNAIDLFGGIGGMTYSFEVQQVVTCARRPPASCCCKCSDNLSTEWKIKDRFDILSSMPCPEQARFPKQLPSVAIDMWPYFRCLAILEDAGFIALGAPFDVRCRFWTNNERKRLHCGGL